MAFGLLYAATNGAFLWAINRGLAQVYYAEAPPALVLLFAALIPVLGAARGIGDFLSKYLIYSVGNRAIRDLRETCVSHLTTLPLSYFVSSRTGETVSRVVNDTLQAETAVSTVIEDLAKEPVTLVLLLGAMFWLDPLLAAASLVLFPVCVMPVVLFGRRVRRHAREAQQRIADVMSILQELIQGARIVKAFSMETYERERFARINNQFFARLRRVARATAAVEPMIVFVSTLGIGAALVYVRLQGMPINQFVTYAGALIMLYTPVKKLSRLHLEVQRGVAAADRIFDLLDRQSGVREHPDARRFEGPVETITFDHVVFRYDDGPAVLDDVSFAARAGQRIAVVGSSGAGKSTLVSLLPRFFDVSGGAVRVNGRDIREYTLRSLRDAMGVVTQDTILFNDTVASNIGYGKPGASREEIIRAAQRANAHEFISALPAGYDTVVGEHGLRLSGGQRQRLAIARAVLRNPPILILDEATSALDTESERLVQAAIHELMEGRTVFAIAHRLSTVADCHRIVVLEGGRIVEEGTHEELMGLGALYKRLYELQFREPEKAEDGATPVPRDGGPARAAGFFDCV
jgi:subfamily B ATP-binding cassette protein MsbA